MPYNITIQFADGEPHTYQNVPENVTPDQIEQRATKDFPDRKLSRIAREAAGGAQRREDSPVPESVSKPEAGLESGGPFKFLEDLGDFLGGATSQFGAEHGVKPEVAAATGAAVNTAIQAIPMVYGGATKFAEKVLGVAEKGAAIAAKPFVKGAEKARGAVFAVRGTGVPVAREAARAGARDTAAGAARATEKEASHEALRVKALDSVRKQNAAVVEKMKAQEPPPLNVQGEHLTSAYKAATNAAVAARRSEYDKLMPGAFSAAEKKEAGGSRVDVSSAVKPLNDLFELTAGTPLETKLSGLVGAVGGGEGGRTFKQLEHTSRLLKDIAYGSPLEGYGAIVKSAARDSAKALDDAMENFAPAYRTAKSTYAEMSKPLESMNTRVGRAIRGGEGGLKEDAYSKVAAQDLPGRVFSKKEGIELMVDALAGGKMASPSARAEAAHQVDGMVENWLLESLRSSPDAAGTLQKLKSPEMRATLSAAPEAAKRVAGRYATMAGHERTSAALEGYAREAGKRGAGQAKKAEALRKDISLGDGLSKLPDVVSKRQALTAYMNAIDRGRAAGALSSEQVDAVNGLISRANTLEEKTRRARKIAGYLKIAGAVGVEETIRHAISK